VGRPLGVIYAFSFREGLTCSRDHAYIEHVNAREDMKDMTKKPIPFLWLSDRRGVYIPRDFANSFANRSKTVSGVDAEDWIVLEAGPDHEHYWEAWDEVLASAVVTDDDGIRFRPHAEGDLWLVPEDMDWDDERQMFVWPNEGEEG
jgi:hypothetical protein